LPFFTSSLAFSGCSVVYVREFTQCCQTLTHLEVFQTSVVGVYSINLADIQTQTRGTSTLAAGFNSSLQSVVPIVLIPLLGAFFDRFGYRMLFSESIRLTSLWPAMKVGLADYSIVDCRVICRRFWTSWPDSSTSSHSNHLGLIRIIHLCSTLLCFNTGHGWRFGVTWDCHWYLESFWQRRHYRFRRGGRRYSRSFRQQFLR